MAQCEFIVRVSLLTEVFFFLSFVSQVKNSGPVRVVFEVTLEGGVRKVVTVRSALLIRNKTDVPVEIRLQAPTAMQGTPALTSLLLT